MNETVEQVDIATGEVTEIPQGAPPAVIEPKTAVTMVTAPERKPRRSSARGDELRTVSEIATAIAKITAEVGVVAKRGENKFHNYKYAKMEDVVGSVSPLLAKYGLIMFQTEIERTMFDDGRVLAVQYEFTIAHISGEVWPDRPRQSGVCRARDSKGGWDDKAFNKCHTAARKYFLLALFQIATGDNEDADEDKDLQDKPRGAPDFVRRRHVPQNPNLKEITPEAKQRAAVAAAKAEMTETPAPAPHVLAGAAEEGRTSSAPEPESQESVSGSGEFSHDEQIAAERERLEVAADTGIDALRAAWNQVPMIYRPQLEHRKEQLKAVARESDRRAAEGLPT